MVSSVCLFLIGVGFFFAHSSSSSHQLNAGVRLTGEAVRTVARTDKILSAMLKSFGALVLGQISPPSLDAVDTGEPVITLSFASSLSSTCSGSDSRAVSSFLNASSSSVFTTTDIASAECLSRFFV